MTLLQKLRTQYGGLVVVVALLMALNVGELVWINSWQGDTDAAVGNAQAASELTVSISGMLDGVYDVKSTALQAADIRDFGFQFKADGSEATDALTAILATLDPDSAEGMAASSLKSDLDQYVLDGAAVAQLDETERWNLVTQTTALRTQGNDLVKAARVFQADLEDVIAGKLDRLGLVGTICLIVSAVLGVVTVVGGAVLGYLLSRNVGRTLNEAVTGISSSAAELMAVATQVAAGAAQTAASTNETTVTVEEVKQTAVLAHEKSSEAADSAQGAIGIADSGRTMTDETIAGIERVQSEMDVVFETITRLSEQTQAAGDIIASVNDLAEQSNLLSVNASIEAAKAGEYGKGFTVVAQEVKSLAEQSKQAVSQVRTMLSEIQKASQTAVQAAARGRDVVEEGRQHSLAAGEVMQNLASGAGENAQSLVQIAASSQQQLAGMEQIAQAIESINEAGNQSAGGTRQVEQEVQHLQDLALRLRRLIQSTEDAQQQAQIGEDHDR